MRGFTKFQAVARGALLRVVRRRYGAHETPFGVELEKFLPPEHGPLGATPARSPRGTPRQPSRTLAEHRRALAEQRRAAQPPPRTGVGNMGTFAPPRTGKASKGALIAAHRGAYNADVSPSRFGGPLDILDCRDDQGSTRERNSQRLRSRPFSTRFG